MYYIQEYTPKENHLRTTWLHTHKLLIKQLLSPFFLPTSEGDNFLELQEVSVKALQNQDYNMAACSNKQPQSLFLFAF